MNDAGWILEPITQDFLDTIGKSPDLRLRSAEEARRALVRLQAGAVGRPSAQIEDMSFPAGPTGSVIVRIVRPSDAQRFLPVIVYIHGGGWCLGGADTHDRVVRELAVAAGAVERFWGAYLPDTTLRSEITAAPLQASVDQLRGLSDALIIVAENDVLRDEGEDYARQRISAGVRATSVRYSVAIHGFVVLNALADTPATRSAIAQAVSALRCVLD